MGTVEKVKLVGEIKRIRAGEIMVDVKVLDYKFSYGRDRWLVTPVAGKGEVWVEGLMDILDRA